MTAQFPTRAEFEAREPELAAYIREWAQREAVPFDVAVLASGPESGGSIWDMPLIDSKRAVALLAELEPKLGCKLPASLAKRGGYGSAEELVESMLSNIRVRCPEFHGPGIVDGTTNVPATTEAPQPFAVGS